MHCFSERSSGAFRDLQKPSFLSDEHEDKKTIAALTLSVRQRHSVGFCALQAEKPFDACGFFRLSASSGWQKFPSAKALSVGFRQTVHADHYAIRKEVTDLCYHQLHRCPA